MNIKHLNWARTHSHWLLCRNQQFLYGLHTLNWDKACFNLSLQFCWAVHNTSLMMMAGAWQPRSERRDKTVCSASLMFFYFNLFWNLILNRGASIVGLCRNTSFEGNGMAKCPVFVPHATVLASFMALNVLSNPLPFHSIHYKLLRQTNLFEKNCTAWMFHQRFPLRWWCMFKRWCH